jgi:hypothetical protein
MTEYTGEVKTVPHSDADVYRVLSDLRALDLLKDKIPGDKLRDFSFDADGVSFRIDPVGAVTFLIVERQPCKLIKFKSDKLPFDIFLWIQIVAKAERDTRLRITVKADLNPFLRGMVEGAIKKVVEQVSDVLAQLPYDQINETMG